MVVNPLRAAADDPLRRVALTLHAASEVDRGWLLERLPQARRAELEGLLAELASLGIPRDPSLIPDARRAPGAVQLTVASIARWLESEPPAVVRCVLDTLDETRRGRVMERLPAALRHRFAARHAAAIPPRFQQAVARELARRGEHEAVTAPARRWHQRAASALRRAFA